MKKILLSLFILVGVVASAQADNFKLKERSEKRAPAWINAVERDYVITSASGSTVEEAKAQVLLNIKEQIASAVASNVSAELLQESVQIETNNASAYSESVKSVVRSATDKIPYLQSISLSSASIYYWEMYYDRKSKQTRYDYYVKYHFPELELQKLVSEFNAIQRKINETIERMASELETFTQIEDIAANMSELRALVPQMVEGDARIKRVDELLISYRNQYKYISLEQVESADKSAVVCPVLNGRAVRTAQVPKYKSNCADRVVINNRDGLIHVSYDDYACTAGEDNWIELKFRFGSYFVSTKVYVIK